MWTDKQLSLKVYSSNLIYLYILSLTQSRFWICMNLKAKCIIVSPMTAHYVSQVFHNVNTIVFKMVFKIVLDDA